MKVRVWLLTDKELEMGSFTTIQQVRPHDLEIDVCLLAELWGMSVMSLGTDEWVSLHGKMGQSLVKHLILEELNKEILI